MNFGAIILRVKNIISSPGEEWKRIAKEKSTSNEIISDFALPLIIILSVSKFIGLVRFGANFSFVAIFVGLINFVSFYAGIYLTSLAVKEIAPTFFSNNEKTNAFKLVVYSAAPVFVASIIANLHPSLFFFRILYLYAAYLIWEGLDILLNTPEKNKLSFVLIIIVILFGIIEATGKILTVLLPVTNAIVG